MILMQAQLDSLISAQMITPKIAHNGNKV